MATSSSTQSLTVVNNKRLESWKKIINLAKKDQKRQERKGKNLTVRFNKENNNSKPAIIQLKEYNPDYASKSIKYPKYKGKKYENETPWYEIEESEEMQWWEYPDLDEEDELTTLCKKVISAGDYDMTSREAKSATAEDDSYHQSRRVNRVQGIVYDFALRLKNKVNAKKNSNGRVSQRGSFSLHPSWSNSSMTSSWLSNSIHKWSNSSSKHSIISILEIKSDHEKTADAARTNQISNTTNSTHKSKSKKSTAEGKSELVSATKCSLLEDERCEDPSERSFYSDSSSSCDSSDSDSSSDSDTDTDSDSDDDSVIEKKKSYTFDIAIDETKIFKPNFSAAMLNRRFNLRQKKFDMSRAA